MPVRILLAIAGLLLAAPAASAQAFAAVDSAVRAGITKGLYPGAVVLIGRRDTILYAHGYGRLTWSATAPAAHPDSTLWDLASVSKVVGTTTAAMILVDRGRLRLDAPVQQYLSRFAGPRKGSVTIRMLLDHTSGLPAYREYFKLAPTRDSMVSLLYSEPLRRTPGTRSEYSDLNALLLGLVIEAISGEPLDRFVQGEVLAPLGMRQTMYRPPAALKARIAPTGSWRGHPVGGVVNDQNAVRMGGVAGHAGLFATGRDLARYAQVWLREGALEKGRLVAPAVMREFLLRTPASGTRRLGWDSPDSALARRGESSAFGTLLTSSAYGHTGWTGTELWVDPTHDLFLVFLTNRSYAPRTSGSIRELRAVRGRLADATVRAAPQPCQATAIAC